MNPEGKPAIQSMTYKGLGMVQTMILGFVVSFIAKKLGVTDSGDIATIKTSVGDIVGLVLAIVGQIGVIAAAVGRNRATQPITGVVRAAPVQTPVPANAPTLAAIPTIAESGGWKPDDPPC